MQLATLMKHQRFAMLLHIDATGTWDGIDGVWEVFADEADLLQAAQHAWFRHLGSAVETAISTGKGDVVKDVRRAYRSAARQHAGLRRLLEQHAQHPAIEHSVHREQALLARAAGVTDAAMVTGCRSLATQDGSNMTQVGRPMTPTRARWSLVRLRHV